MHSQSPLRRLPIGAEPLPGGGVGFRVWAPDHRSLELVLESPSSARRVCPMTSQAGGYFAAEDHGAAAGWRYGYRPHGVAEVLPDPASRFQPEGVHGLSEVVDPCSYRWHDGDWKGVGRRGQVVYELHVGTFTPEGTFAAAIERLPWLAELGITAVELMPVNEFAGEFGWGYDGVGLFAPTRLYGCPDDLRRFVDEAHRLKMGVLLDAVYNHLGPRGNYLTAFARDYFTARHKTDWGAALNFDAENSAGVREFFLANAGYWIDEFHFDGLRLDAVHAIVDDSGEHILQAIARRVRESAPGRATLVIAENEHQQAHLLRPTAAGGFDLDAAWNDDFHHALRVAVTGQNDFYYADYAGTPQELISAVRRGYLYQGQYNPRQQKYRGTPAGGLAAEQFVHFTQNHDQVANSARGERLGRLTSPGRERAATALLLLGPQTPLLFQGQEYGATTPFFYFADHEPDLAPLVREGRLDHLKNFAGASCPPSEGYLPDPCDAYTFRRSKLDWAEADRNTATVAFYRDLLRLRREDAVFAAQAAERIEGAVLAAEALLLRYFGDDGDDRLLLLNLGRDLVWRPVAEPLAAAPADRRWTVQWSSEEPRYGGPGVAAFDARAWRLPAHAATVLKAVPA